MKRAGPFVLLLAGAILAGCGSSTGSTGPTVSAAATSQASSPASTRSAAPSPSEVGSVGPFPDAGCPVTDRAFCTPAAAVAEAIVAGDAAAIVALSRPDVFTCKDLDATIFTGCASAETLEGHPIGTVSGTIDVHSPTAYRDELDARLRTIDPTFTDASGSGDARVLGTSACGPDDPARRSYYVAWTAAMPNDAGTAERMVGLYEFTFRDDKWLVGILYLDTETAWKARHAEPLRDVGCGISAWGAG